MKASKVTLEDVARTAGVSPATVSRCLNDPSTVRPAKRERINAAVDQLGYVPHGAARALASNRTLMIGAVFPSLDTSLFGGMLESLQAEVADSGYTLVVASTGYDPDKELEDVRNLLSSGVDALTLVGTAHDQRTMDLIDRKGTPYVLNWEATRGGSRPSIGFDNRMTTVRLARYLLDLGHRSFGIISGIRAHNDRAEMRFRGLAETIAEHGISLHPDAVIERPFGLDEGRDAFRRLMNLAEPPTAIVCGSEPFAYGAIYEAAEMGLNVPRDVSITGIDDMWLAAHIRPSLTTIQTPRREIGVEVGRYLLARLRGEDVLCPGPLETRLVVRESTGPAPA